MDIPTGGIVVLTIALLTFWVLLNRRSWNNKTFRDPNTPSGVGFAFGLIVWLTATAAFALTGIVQSDARLMMVAVVPGFSGAALLAMSKFGGRIASATPWFALVGYLAFRLPLELILDQLYSEGRLPMQMTFHGLNYDIVIGAAALPLAIWAAVKSTTPRLLLIAWNTFGFGLLNIIGLVAVFSLPTPFRLFANEPSTILLSEFPFIWIPAFLAASALAGHILIYRKLMIERCNRINDQNHEALV